jgi:hypothetical protein
MQNLPDNEIDFSGIIAAVAQELFGEPNPELSNAKELRFGSHGSKKIDLNKGTYYDFESDQGGGCIAMVAHSMGYTETRDCMQWLNDQGFIDDKPLPKKQPPPPSAATKKKNKQLNIATKMANWSIRCCEPSLNHSASVSLHLGVAGFGISMASIPSFTNCRRCSTPILIAPSVLSKARRTFIP